MTDYIVSLRPLTGGPPKEHIVRDALNRGHAIKLAALRLTGPGPFEVTQVWRHDGRVWRQANRACEHPGRNVERQSFAAFDAGIRIVSARCHCGHTWKEVHCVGEA